MDRKRKGFEVRKKQKDHYSKDKETREIVDQEDLEKWIDGVEKAWNKTIRDAWFKNKKFKSKYTDNDGENKHIISRETGE